MIRGTAVTLNRHSNQANRRQQQQLRPVQVPRGPRQVSHTTSGHTNANKSKKLPSSKPKTYEELKEVLNEWNDPEDDAQEVEAKKRIQDSYRRGSERLDLSCLSLSTLPDVFEAMSHVKDLTIANNYFSEIPDTLTKLSNLRRLDVSNNILTQIPDSIKELKKLERLNATCNQLNQVSEELGLLPKLQKVMLSHNRILKFPKNINRIKNTQLDDQIPPASFSDFSPDFAIQWQETFKYEGGSGFFEIWLARYEEILRSPSAAKDCPAFKQRIGMLLDGMTKYPNLRQYCYHTAQNIVSTCYDGILYSLYVMEIEHILEKIMALELSDEQVRLEIKRIYNFTRLQELATLHSERCLDDETSATEMIESYTLETILFFYVSSTSDLDMPFNDDKIRFMCRPKLPKVTNKDVEKAVAQIQHEKHERALNLLIDFVLERDFWLSYLSHRYSELIEEHTQTFMDQMERLEAEIDRMREYEYMKGAEAISEEKAVSEKKLFLQLTKNIMDESEGAYA